MSQYAGNGMLIVLGFAMDAMGAGLMLSALFLVEEAASVLTSPYFLLGIALMIASGPVILLAFFKRNQAAQAARPQPRYIDVAFFDESGRLR